MRSVIQSPEFAPAKCPAARLSGVLRVSTARSAAPVASRLAQRLMGGGGGAAGVERVKVAMMLHASSESSHATNS